MLKFRSWGCTGLLLVLVTVVGEAVVFGGYGLEEEEKQPHAALPGA